MNSRNTVLPLGAIAIAVLALAGCTGGTAEREDRKSPLDAYLNGPLGDMSSEDQDAYFAEQNRNVEEAVAECMTAEGFEYIPVVDQGEFISSDDVEWEPDERDWVQQYGYGLLNTPFSVDPPEDVDMATDPNEEYLASLSESEQEAFYAALYGASPTEEEIAEAGGEEEYEWETAGCYGAAQEKFMDGMNQVDYDEHEELFAALEQLYTTMQDGPEMADLNAEWAACMDEAGHPGYATQADPSNELMSELDALYQETPEGLDPESAEGKEFAAREIEVALADLDCREKSDFADGQADIMFELEKQFVVDHKAELEAFKAASEQGIAGE